MASVMKRNKRRWKGVKWINAPFANRAKALGAVYASMAAASSIMQVNAIRATQTENTLDAIEKKIAMTDALISGAKSMVRAREGGLIAGGYKELERKRKAEDKKKEEA